MAVIIKKAEKTDAIQFAEVNEKIWNTPATQDIVEYFQKGISMFRDGYYLAEIDGKVVGSSEGFPIKEKLPISLLSQIDDPVDLYDPNGQYYYIHIVQVYPFNRKQGIGELLLKAQIETSKRFLINEVCGIAISNRLNHWEKYGFKEEGEWGRYKNYGNFKWISLKLDSFLL